MPTIDLEDRYRPQRLGKVRLGIKKVNKKGVEYPSATDYFVLPDIPGLKKIYGEKPKVLDLVFLFDSIDMVFPHFHKWYSGRGLRCLGDGEIVYYRTDGEAEKAVVTIRNAVMQLGTTPERFEEWKKRYGSYEPIGNTVACDGVNCSQSNGINCRPTGRLCFSPIGLPMLGYLELTVHQRALLGIAGQLKLAYHIFGHLTGIPFRLTLVKETVQVQAKSRKIYTPQLTIEEEWLSTNLPKPEERKALVEAKAAAAKEALFGPEDAQDLDYTPTSPEEIQQAQNGEDGSETVVQEPWSLFWAFVKANEDRITMAEAGDVLEEAGGEPVEALKRLKAQYGAKEEAA